MKRYILGMAAAAALLLPAVPAMANGDDHGDRRTYYYGRWYGGDHSRFHDDLEHRDFHRDLEHRDAHRYPMTRRQHGQLHDQLEHDAYHDRLEHRSYHRDYYSPRYGYGSRSRDYSPRVRIYPPGYERYYFRSQDRYGRQPSVYFYWR